MTATRCLSAFAALGLVFSTTTASARTLRQPEMGSPAIEVEIPDDWTSTRDKSANLIVGSANHTAAFALNVYTNSEPVEALARKALTLQKVDPIPDSRPASIAGHPGVSYEWTVANPGKATVHMMLILVRIDATHVVNCTKVLAETSSPETRQIANWIAQDLRISGAAP